MNERLKILRNTLNLSQEAFANKLGVTAPGISKIENSQRKLTDQMIVSICRVFLVNENWLRYGEGDVFKKAEPTGLDQLADFFHLDELDKKIILEFSQLNEKKRMVIKEYIMNIAYGTSTTAVSSNDDIEEELLKYAVDLGNENYISNSINIKKLL